MRRATTQTDDDGPVLDGVGQRSDAGQRDWSERREVMHLVPRADTTRDCRTTSVTHVQQRPEVLVVVRRLGPEDGVGLIEQDRDRAPVD